MSNILNISYTSAPGCYLECTFKTTTDNTGQYFPANVQQTLQNTFPVVYRKGKGNGDNKIHTDKTTTEKSLLLTFILRYVSTTLHALLIQQHEEKTTHIPNLMLI